MRKIALMMVTCAVTLCAQLALAGPLDPECTPEKAAKGAAAKATIGVGGRCAPAEAVKDTTKRAVGVDDKGPIEKRRDNDKPGEAVRDIVK